MRAGALPEERIYQVLSNLVGNAMKFTPAGGRVTVDAARDGDFVRFRVTDTGPGIPAGDHEAIFKEFTRLHPGAQQGAGVGLAISRLIARLLGGDLHHADQTRAQIDVNRRAVRGEEEGDVGDEAAWARLLSGLLRDSGDGAGQDQADLGATSFERDHELTVLNHEREKLAQIDRALARIDDGTYGVCESCGNPIGKMRLMAFPRATLCLSCKQREERR